MPSTFPVVSRRRALAGGAAVVVLGVLATACGSAPPPDVDDLVSQLELARHDSALTTAAAAAAPPPIAPALTTIAAQRADHAQALTTEIARVTGRPAPTSTTATSTGASPAAAPPPSVPDVVHALHTSADGAATLVGTSEGYRAGLLGSIAAACTAAYTVALADRPPEPAKPVEPPASVSTTGDTPGDAALADALTTEHAVVYGYGMVSAHSPPDVNYLVADALHQHRARRDHVVAMLSDRSVTAPVAAAGYQLPMPVHDATDAAQLAVRMENDSAVAWRAVLEQAHAPGDRTFAVAALTRSAVLAAQWNQVLGAWPITETFPGGTE